jgi:cellulose 1,4-beta-cellobiosidase
MNVDKTCSAPWITSLTNPSNIADGIKTLQKYPAAFWLDQKSKVDIKNIDQPDNLHNIIKENSDKAAFNFIVYDLPQRDCSAGASSNGDFKDANPENMQRYKDEYIGGIKTAVENNPDKQFSFIIEPDSIPNLVTNTAVGKCGAEFAGNPEYGYIPGIKYAIDTLCTKENTVCYLDAGNGGWLGWENNMTKLVNQVKELGAETTKHLRGFSANVSNYNPLGEVCEALYDSDTAVKPSNITDLKDKCPNYTDPCNLSSQSNYGYNSLSYGEYLVRNMKGASIPFSSPNGPKMVIDTSRNGVAEVRNGQQCSSWCNPLKGETSGKAVGIGHHPASHDQLEKIFGRVPEWLDAFAYLKTPGETDGNSTGKGVDAECSPNPFRFGGASAGNLPVPHAGDFFPESLCVMAGNAVYEGIDNKSGGKMFY